MAVAEKVSVELELRDGQYRSNLKTSEREFERSMDATKRAAADAERGVQRTLGRLPDSLRQQYRDLGTDIGRSLGGVSRAAQIAFGAVVAYSLNAARKAEDVNDAFAFTFSEMGSNADTAATKIATSFNRTSVQIKGNLTNSFQVLTGLGLEATQAFAGAQELVARSIDLASQKGISDARAYEAIIGGLTGETEPLKRLGVVISEATVKAELLRLGFKGSTANATEAQKAVARYNLILAKTSTAQGDVARTSESANNKMKEAQTEFENAATALGEELLPALVDVFGAATDVLRGFNDMSDGAKTFALGALALIASAGPIAGLIANLIRLRNIAIATAAAVKAATIGGGAAAGGAVAGGVAAAAGVGGALLVSQASFAPAPPGPNSDVDERIAFARRNNWGARGMAPLLEEKRVRDARLTGLRESLAKLAYGPTGVPSVDEGVVGGFGLGGLANAPGTTGGGSGGGASGPSAEDIAARRETLRLQNELNLAEAQGRTAAAAVAQRQLDINALEADFKAAQIDDARTLATAQVDAIIAGENQAKALTDLRDAFIETMEREAEAEEKLNAETERRLRFRLQLAVIAGDETEIRRLERELSLLQRINDLGGNAAQARAEENALNTAEDDAAFRERGAQAARSFIDIIRSDDIGAELGNRFREAAFDGLESILTNLFSQAFSGGGGGLGGIFSSVASVFGGGRASGGPVRAGFTYDVGERGREKFVAPANGFIIPNMGGSAKSSSPTSITIRQSFDLAGVSGDQAIYANVGRMIQQGQRQTLAIVKSSAPSVQLERTLLQD